MSAGGARRSIVSVDRWSGSRTLRGSRVVRIRPVRLLRVWVSEGWLKQTLNSKGWEFSCPLNFIGSLPESLTRGLLVGKLLVGGLGVATAGGQTYGTPRWWRHDVPECRYVWLTIICSHNIVCRIASNGLKVQPKVTLWCIVYMVVCASFTHTLLCLCCFVDESMLGATQLDPTPSNYA